MWRKERAMKNEIRLTRNEMVKRAIGRAVLCAFVAMLAIELFGCGEDNLCPVTVVTAIAAVTFGFIEIVTTLREAVDG